MLWVTFGASPSSVSLTKPNPEPLRLELAAAWFIRPDHAKSCIVSSDSAPPPLSVSSLTKSFDLGDQKVEVLTGVHLELELSEICAIMGPSGVGKSTLLNLAAGLEQPTSGHVRLFGEDTTHMDDDQRTRLRRHQIGIVYQFFNLVPNLSVRENVQLPYLIDGQAPDEDAIHDCLNQVGLAHRENHFPAQLSGGEMQLASIARAIVRRPRLILADEPTGNVNVKTGHAIMTVLRQAVQDTKAALLLVTHNPEDAAFAHRVVFMKDGLIDENEQLKGDQVHSDAIHSSLQRLEI